MRKTALAGLFLCAMIFSANSPRVSAKSVDIASFHNSNSEMSELAIKQVTKVQVKQPFKAKKHTVKKSQTLTSIAKEHNTTWRRLYNKNKKIENPDVLKVGQEVVIPLPEEKLKERPLPETAPLEVESSVDKPATQVQYVSRSSSSGNGYVHGYCTWYAKQRRPDLPNNLGNADTWVSRARAQGIPTGSTPRVGAIGQQGMHVVYVEKVHGDGTVTISEMNFKGWNQVSSRTVAASNFQYIY